jgi:signal transduction histidine kinase
MWQRSRYFLWPQRFGGRAILVLLASILLMLLGSIAIQHDELAGTGETLMANRVAGQLVTVARALAALNGEARDAAAHAMSSDLLGVHWEATSAVTGGSTPEALTALETKMLSLAPDLLHFGLRLGYAEGDRTASRRTLLGSLTLADGSYVNFSVHPEPASLSLSHQTLLYMALMAAAVAALAIFLMISVTAPLRDLARAVDAIGRGPIVPVTESGPFEIKRLSHAFNAMQARIHKLIVDRTTALAAVSHDLRTPITRLRLRAGFAADVDAQRAMDGDLDDMEAMIEATLLYLKGGSEAEDVKRTDLAALIATLVDDATDIGHTITYEGPAHLTLPLRSLSIKRALSNLIGNATHYGTRVKVSLERVSGHIKIRVEDNGPGIPEDALEQVFEPFERLDTARGRSTGSTGLGLSIARQAIDQEGGRIKLGNHPEGGLVAEVFLPAAPTG